MRLLAKSLLAGALVFTAAAPAFADPPRYEQSRRWDNDRRGPDYRYDRSERHAYRDGYQDARRHDGRQWRRGDRFDRHVHHVVVHDYNRYRLPPPRRGEYYARTDTGEILLIAAATGLVVWALSN
jgi:Ni/Co efflux regulator RcnB